MATTLEIFKRLAISQGWETEEIQLVINCCMSGNFPSLIGDVIEYFGM